MRLLCCYIAVVWMAQVPMVAFAIDAPTASDDNAAADERWNAHFQSTYIWQQKEAFDAAYSGPNSLTTKREDSYSFTTTGYFGVRLWQGGELYADPEVSRGRPLSNLTGLGGFTNGEMARTSGSEFKLYRARLYLHQTWNLGSDAQTIEDGPNQLATTIKHDRISLTIGNISMLDVFDPCSYSHDPRTGFLNWALITYGPYDFASDARGYTWAAIAELYKHAWAIRVGRAMLPKQPNQLELDTRMFQHYGDQLEIEHDHKWSGQNGAVRVLAYHDRAVMSRYVDAISLAQATRTTPDINAVRTGIQDKFGIGLSMEQSVGDSSGVFARAMWADGQSETEAYATIDRSVAAGVVLHGGSWHRAQDSTGFAYGLNGLSAEDRHYLAAGGVGFFVGDGRLRYGAEQIGEMYYNLYILKGLSIAADLQHITNPAYNRDRGPVTLIAMRLHAEM